VNRFYGVVYVVVLMLAIGFGWAVWRDGRQTTVLVEWTTASELDTAGFNLHRGESQEGPFTRINENLIPASADQLTGGSYGYEDHPVQPGKVYYYRLEELEFDGSSNYFGPISVQAEGTSTPGYYLSLGLIAALLAYGAFTLFQRVRAPASGMDGEG